MSSLVGRSHECGFPASVRALRVLTRAKLDVRGSSTRIDRGVRALVEHGLSVYELDVEGLRRAVPAREESPGSLGRRAPKPWRAVGRRC